MRENDNFIVMKTLPLASLIIIVTIGYWHAGGVGATGVVAGSVLAATRTDRAAAVPAPVDCGHRATPAGS